MAPFWAKSAFATARPWKSDDGDRPISADDRGRYRRRFALGFLAKSLKLPPVLGYLAGGMIAGPHLFGVTADPDLAVELSNLGLVLVMFGIGLKFPPRRMSGLSWRAVPGALLQMGITTALGFGLGSFLGLGAPQSLIFGVSLVIAGVSLAMPDPRERDGEQAQAAELTTAWLMVQTLAAVLLLIVMPLIAQHGEGAAGARPLAGAIGIKALEIGLLMLIMLVLGRRIVPALIVIIARTRSRELFALGIAAIAAGIIYAAYSVFGAGIALGAFIAGLVLSEAELSQRAAGDVIPLRDAFAVLFFVSLGMMFDPAILTDRTGAVLAMAAIIVIGNGGGALALAWAMRAGLPDGAKLAGRVAQTGEFSVLIGSVALALGLLTEQTYLLIAAGALISACLNPLVRLGFDMLAAPRTAERPVAATTMAAGKK
ncbi:MAG: hypothetical protein HC850_02680 [Rhodomicrobium sp.]|nr:hypothetical protein [Rhodomicrobium sp.]